MADVDPRLAALLADVDDPNILANAYMEHQRRLKEGRSQPPAEPPSQTSGEMRSALSPEVDATMEGLGLPTRAGPMLNLIYALGSAGPRQVQKAQGTIGSAVDDPSIANVANAGVQTGAAGSRPALTLGSAGVGYADALLKDLGLFNNEAQAQGEKKETAPKMVLPGLSKGTAGIA